MYTQSCNQRTESLFFAYTYDNICILHCPNRCFSMIKRNVRKASHLSLIIRELREGGRQLSCFVIYSVEQHKHLQMWHRWRKGMKVMKKKQLPVIYINITPALQSLIIGGMSLISIDLQQYLLFNKCHESAKSNLLCVLL